MAKTLSIGARAANGRVIPPSGGKPGPLPPNNPLAELRAARGLVQSQVGAALFPEAPKKTMQSRTSRYERGAVKMPEAVARTYAALVDAPWQRVQNLANQAWAEMWDEAFVPIPEPGDEPQGAGDAGRLLPSSDIMGGAKDTEKETGMNSGMNTGMNGTGRNGTGGATVLESDVISQRLKPVTGRDLEKVIATFVWNKAGAKPNEVIKLSEECVLGGLKESGFAATLAQVRGAMVSLMSNKRLTVVRDCPEMGTRIYKTTERLRAFAGLWDDAKPLTATLEQLPIQPRGVAADAPSVPDAAFSSAGQRDGKTLAQPLPAATQPLPVTMNAAPAEGMTAPAQATEPGPGFGGDADIDFEDVRAQQFENQLLDMLVRAQTGRDAEKRAAMLESQRDAALTELEAAGERYQALQGKLDAEIGRNALLEAKAGVGGRDRHAVKKADYILGQVAGQMQNPMVAAFFESINVKAADLEAAMAATAKIAGGADDEGG